MHTHIHRMFISTWILVDVNVFSVSHGEKKKHLACLLVFRRYNFNEKYNNNENIREEAEAIYTHAVKNARDEREEKSKTSGSLNTTCERKKPHSHTHMHQYIDWFEQKKTHPLKNKRRPNEWKEEFEFWKIEHYVELCLHAVAKIRSGYLYPFHIYCILFQLFLLTFQ